MKNTTLMRQYQIEWLNEGPGATGQIGWTPDGIGDDNVFDTKTAAVTVMRELRRAARTSGEKVNKLRVVEIPCA